MIKKIQVSDLTLKMFIHDLNCSWMQHSFVHNKFMVEDAAQIAKIIATGTRHVYIDTERGVDIAIAANSENVIQEQANKKQALSKVVNASIQIRTSFQDELIKTQSIFSKASSLVNNILSDSRKGKQVEVNKIMPVISSISDSIYRNPDAFISLLKVKAIDTYTYQHSLAVSALLISFCRTMKIDKSTTELIGLGGLLHDIGKTKLPDSLLNKTEKLSESENDLIRKHVAYGCFLLQTTADISPISLSIVEEHHERYDGSGYPRALKGDEISLYGQMAGIVDTYDAMISNTFYHQAEEPTVVLKKMMAWSDNKFDTALVHNFIRTIGIYPVGTLVRLESGYLAVVVEQNHEHLLQPKIKVIFNSQSRSYCPPKNIDLAKQSGNDRILSVEMASNWQINPFKFV
jgi:putative nucleotidyltransferase with HDIG domain